MGFFKKLLKIHDKVVHPVENYFKGKGGSNTVGGFLKGVGITPTDAPPTVPGSSFQQRPGYNPQTHMFDPTGPTQGTPVSNTNNGGRTYTPNPFAQQMAQANSIRQPQQLPGGQPIGGMQQPQVQPAVGNQPGGPPQQGMTPEQMQMIAMQQQGRAGMF